MNDDQYLLASAYLDGELTAEERALAEADPDVMSEIDQLLALQARVRLVEPPSETAREAAIGAAMEAFADVAARPAPPINAVTRTVEFRRRPSYARYLGLAAAVVAVGLLGLVIATSLRTDVDDASTADEPASADAASELFADEASDEPASDDSDRVLTESAEAEIGVAADAAAPAAGDAAAEPAAEPADEPADAASDEPADEPAAEPADGDDLANVRPTIDVDQPLTSPEQLGAYGSYLVELRNDRTLPPTPNTPCTQQEILGLAQYVFDGLPIDVLVAIDEVERTVSAIHLDTCEQLVLGPLFE